MSESECFLPNEPLISSPFSLLFEKKERKKEKKKKTGLIIASCPGADSRLVKVMHNIYSRIKRSVMLCEELLYT